MIKKSGSMVLGEALTPGQSGSENGSSSTPSSSTEVVGLSRPSWYLTC